MDPAIILTAALKRGLVTEAEARRAGFADVPAFRRWLETMKAGSLFQKIEVGFIGEAE